MKMKIRELNSPLTRQGRSHAKKGTEDGASFIAIIFIAFLMLAAAGCKDSSYGGEGIASSGFGNNSGLSQISGGIQTLRFTSQYDNNLWAARNIVDQEVKRGWCSRRHPRFPEEIVLQLPGSSSRNLSRVEINPSTIDVPMNWSKRVSVLTANTAKGPWVLAGTLDLAKEARFQGLDFTPKRATHLMVRVESNWGGPLTELGEVRIFESTYAGAPIPGAPGKQYAASSPRGAMKSLPPATAPGANKYPLVYPNPKPAPGIVPPPPAPAAPSAMDDDSFFSFPDEPLAPGQTQTAPPIQQDPWVGQEQARLTVSPKEDFKSYIAEPQFNRVEQLVDKVVGGIIQIESKGPRPATIRDTWAPHQNEIRDDLQPKIQEAARLVRELNPKTPEVRDIHHLYAQWVDQVQSAIRNLTQAVASNDRSVLDRAVANLRDAGKTRNELIQTIQAFRAKHDKAA